MRDLSAISLTDHVRAWLTDTEYPRILHVFDGACNLINEDKQVLSVVTQQIGSGPFNVVVGDDIRFSDHVSIDSPTSLLDGRMILGELTIETANAKQWNPHPDWETMRGLRYDIAHQLMKLRITDYRPQIPESLTSAVSSVLVNVSVPSTKEIASELAGLGNGLTPAGDDFLLGAMYAAWIIHPGEIARLLAREIAETAAPLTTSLSAAWLRSAGRGEAGIQWHHFFQALISGDPTRTEETTNEILLLGETSGADALSGFVGTFVAWIDQKASKNG